MVMILGSRFICQKRKIVCLANQPQRRIKAITRRIKNFDETWYHGTSRNQSKCIHMVLIKNNTSKSYNDIYLFGIYF